MPRKVGKVLAPVLAIAVGAAAPAWSGGVTERVSVGPGGVQSNSFSSEPAISADGRFVAFHSEATNLVPGDTNRSIDVFVRDRQRGRTERVSLSTGGAQGNGDSGGFVPFGTPSAISAEGRFVASTSEASNLVPGDTNDALDVFVRDRQRGRTERVSLSTGGAQGNDASLEPALSADGRFVAFTSFAANLVPGDTNFAVDVFVRDRRTGTTQRVSVGPGGVQGNGDSFVPALSADGRFVAFGSGAANLVPGDTNGLSDVFVRDRRTGTTRRVSVGPGGVQGNDNSFSPEISVDGRVVAFGSGAASLVPGDTNNATDVFVRDRRAGLTRRVSVGPGGIQGNERSNSPALSPGGRFIAFRSAATNLVPGDTNNATDVLVRDRRAGLTRRVSVGPGGVQGDDSSFDPALSAGGRVVTFRSRATNLVAGDTNGVEDIFVHTR